MTNRQAFTDLVSPRPSDSSKPEILTAYDQKVTPPLPTILCLHGGGVSARIFRFQLRNLTSALKSEFNFVFVDAPIASGPGPGVLPYFENVPPYWRWVQNVGLEGSGSEAEWDEVRKQVAPRLKIVLDRVRSEGWGPVVGVVGFSQGCRVAAGLLLRQATPQKERRDADIKLDIDLRFGIFVGGGWPPIYFTPPPHPSTETMKETPGALKERIAVPTVHAWGRDDPQRVAARALMDWATPGFGTAQTFEFNGGHHMPMIMSETRELADMVLDIWRDCEAAGMRDGNGWSS